MLFDGKQNNRMDSTSLMDSINIPQHVQTKVQSQKVTRVAIVPGNGNAAFKAVGNVKTSKMHQFKPPVSLVKYFLIYRLKLLGRSYCLVKTA